MSWKATQARRVAVAQRKARPYPAAPVAKPVPMPVAQPPAGTHGSADVYATTPVVPSYAGSSAGLGPAAPSLGEDPAYLAFLRAAAGEESDVRGATQDRVDVLNRELARQLPEIAQAGEYTREGISGNFESRGLFRSGAHEQGLARQRAAEATQTGGLQGMIADQRSLLEQDMARKLAEIKRRTAEASLQAAGSVYR